VAWGTSGGLSIGLPPVINFGSKYLQDRVVRSVLDGTKFICLAITEPYAGSDVANIRCTARKSDCGKYYIVNGEKKWITNGTFADFFTVAVRTGGEVKFDFFSSSFSLCISVDLLLFHFFPPKGMTGVSLLLIERDFGNIETKQMKCSGVWPSGTAYITFDNVKVPVENLIGKENEGFKYIMFNFVCPALFRWDRYSGCSLFFLPFFFHFL
jgi:alkylation response protein AidB-like acyl-CoA dehydrogenase